MTHKLAPAVHVGRDASSRMSALFRGAARKVELFTRGYVQDLRRHRFFALPEFSCRDRRFCSRLHWAVI